VDFDSLYGHRRDPDGYARCLREFDTWLGGFIEQVLPEDLVILTADHGNDPYHPGTDHTREQVPVLTLGLSRHLTNGVYSDVSRWVEERLSAR
jgi:phosphopentomutase